MSLIATSLNHLRFSFGSERTDQAPDRGAELVAGDGSAGGAARPAAGVGVVRSLHDSSRDYRTPGDVSRDPWLESHEKIRILEKWAMIATAKHRLSGNIEYLNQVREANTITAFLKTEAGRRERFPSESHFGM